MTRFRNAASAEPARWVIENTHGFADNIGSLVPHGFEAYARVLHPARVGGPEGRNVTWAEVAAPTGRVVHPEVQWPSVAFIDPVTDINHLYRAPAGAPWESAPEEGSLDLDIALRLAEVLRRHTTTPERCWFAMWEGWGGLRSDIKQAPHFELPGRGYFLLEGPIDAISESAYVQHGYQSASLWWPDDRAWCVATEVDLESTYIGGSAQCIASLADDSDVEVLRAELTHGVTWASDTINPNPLRLESGPPRSMARRSLDALMDRWRSDEGR